MAFVVKCRFYKHPVSRPVQRLIYCGSSLLIQLISIEGATEVQVMQVTYCVSKEVVKVNQLLCWSKCKHLHNKAMTFYCADFFLLFVLYFILTGSSAVF